MPAKRKTKETAKKYQAMSTQAQAVLLAIMGLALTGMLFAYAMVAVNL